MSESKRTAEEVYISLTEEERLFIWYYYFARAVPEIKMKQLSEKLGLDEVELAKLYNYLSLEFSQDKR